MDRQRHSLHDSKQPQPKAQPAKALLIVNLAAVPYSIHRDHARGAIKWITLGIDSSGVMRVVVHTFEQVNEKLCHIRIISARKATQAEVRQYQEAE